VNFLYGPIFKVIGFFYRIYTANTKRFSNLVAGNKLSSLMQNGAVLLVVIWILVWFFASEESRGKLTREVKEGIGNFSTQIHEE
jgi:hypothetical protein